MSYIMTIRRLEREENRIKQMLREGIDPRSHQLHEEHMGDHVPPPPKPPVYKTYAERKAAEDRARLANNKQTHRNYQLPPVPPPGGGRRQRTYWDPIPSAGDDQPTRDQEPVRLPIKHKVEQGKFADIISIYRNNKE